METVSEDIMAKKKPVKKVTKKSVPKKVVEAPKEEVKPVSKTNLLFTLIKKAFGYE
jgi:hypothetical protein